jgi:hypothetical protein
MQVKSTIIAIMLCTLLGAITSNKTNAQAFCTNEVVLWSENFGTGTTASNNTDVRNDLEYQATGDLNDGFFRVINNTQQRPEWHNSSDYTLGDVNGKMLVVNGTGGEVYRKTLTSSNSGYLPGTYAVSMFLMNVNTPTTNCGSTLLKPIIDFRVEYSTNSNGGNWILIPTQSFDTTAPTANPTWKRLGELFNLPVIAQRIRFTIMDGNTQGCGNDFAIDDIKLATCPAGAPLPVEFINLSAAQKGGGVAINWSTSSENNNSYFDVEKSIDGNSFTAINRVKGAGNSSTVKNYGSYDPKPVQGFNYYRIKQVDYDGKFKYSDVVNIKISFDKTGISVLANPFVNNITADVASPFAQRLSIKLSDISGRVVATDAWQVIKGSSRVVMNKVTNLSNGMYILTVTDDNGVVLYNNKLVKQ